jgi:nucleoside-diphosphate-sugar epimerase
MKKAFVTGATGFIGSHLAERLIRDGFELRALARPNADVSLLRALRAEILTGDLSNVGILHEGLAGCNHVYHLAAKTSTSRASRHDSYVVNVEGTENLCRAAIKAGIERFVHGSTAGIYGLLMKSPVDETAQPRPNSFYRYSKYLSEKIVQQYSQSHDLPVVIARLSSVYGPRSYNWKNLFQDVSRKRFRMIGSGENLIQLGFVTDIVSGLRLCGDTPNVEGRDYILTGNEPVSVRHFVDLIATEAGVGNHYPKIPLTPFYPFALLGNFAFKTFQWELPFSHQTDFFLSEKFFSIKKAKRELKYSPSVSLKDGVAQSLLWYRENGLL